MMDKNNRKWFITTAIIVILFLVVIISMILTFKPMPIALLQQYGISTLWEEGKVMNNCAECHDTADFHDCTTCHDDHGAVELTNIPFSKIVELTGDVPNPSFVRINQVIPNQENLGTHITLFQFLKLYGVDTFESVTFTTNDGGITTIERQYLDETALLVPYVDGIRFITKSVHSSTWLKGIDRITIVGEEKPLVIDGKATSIGRLLLGETIRVIVEASDVMLTDESGKTSHAMVGNWVEGPRLVPLLKNPSPESITLMDSKGNQMTLTGQEIQNAIIAIVRDQVTLVLPDRGRSAWPTEITEIGSN